MKDLTDRYRKQLVLPVIGWHGQQRIRDARVLVVGMGGLGCPAAQALVGAGVGTMGIVDGDHVSLDNLHRQLLFTEADIGRLKVAATKQALQNLNSETEVLDYPFFLTRQNARTLISSYDIVLDCTDNSVATLLIDDACFVCNKPHIYGGIDQFQGQVSVFNLSATDHKKMTRYRDVFGKTVENPLAADCEERGTVGMVAGIIGMLQASEALKIILSAGSTLDGQLLVVDLLRNDFNVFSIVTGSLSSDSGMATPGDEVI